jgi:hypothetical protein
MGSMQVDKGDALDSWYNRGEYDSQFLIGKYIEISYEGLSIFYLPTVKSGNFVIGG